jgi:16S rRNA (guanine527-N7)-methyltransferase
MAVVTREWIERLIKGAAVLGVELAPEAANDLATFADRLVEWGAKMDLSSITDLDQIREKHFLDSLAAAPLLDRGGSLVDMGSGPGFPGLVLAVVRPDLQVVSVESRSKKTSFQRQVVRDLDLTNVEVRTARVEELVAKDAAPVWITARAVAELGDLIALVSRWLEDGGSTLVAWKASKSEAEIASAAKSLKSTETRVLRRPSFRLPESGDYRELVFVGRTNP